MDRPQELIGNSLAGKIYRNVTLPSGGATCGLQIVSERAAPGGTATACRSWSKVGVELELMAPRGASRRDLADAIAASVGGTAKRIFYPQSEYSRIDEAPILENLTLGFEVRDGNDALIARCVDDLTLIHDLDRSAGPAPGWYRILSDDKRLLSLAQQNCDAAATMPDVLAPLAALFGVEAAVEDDGGLIKVSDKLGLSVAICAPLPGERQRPCELITPPLSEGRDAALLYLLGHADRLGFTVPLEAATHLHFDGAALQSAPTIANTISVFGQYRKALRHLVGTNENCTRLGDWPKAVYRTVATTGFAELTWQDAAERLREARPVKYSDFNFINLLGGNRDKCTFEVRILPGTKDAGYVSAAIRLFEAILLHCTADHGNAAPMSTVIDAKSLPPFADFIVSLPLSPADHAYWQTRMPPPTKRSRFGFASRG